MSEKEKLFKSVFDYIEINGFANFSLNELSKQKILINSKSKNILFQNTK